CQHHNSHPYSF
nr:immunoglobulin light chain junction region [Macaca mulatta]